MAPRTRNRIIFVLLVLALVGGAREFSIRRHEADLDDWPRPDGTN